jgi:predicted 2-oxoglutarate/Fe(II)-dependent dioxygenase YbiX
LHLWTPAKRNRQLPEESAAAQRAGELVLDALGRSPLFIGAALPAKVWPPLFKRYAGGEQFGVHVDNALRVQRDGVERLRSDLSATLFLCEPDSKAWSATTRGGACCSIWMSACSASLPSSAKDTRQSSR